MIVVTDTTPPSGKTISWMGSLGRCRRACWSVGAHAGAVRDAEVQVGEPRQQSIAWAVAAGLGLHRTSGAPRRLGSTAFDYSTSGRLCHGLRHRRSDRGYARPAATSMCTTHP
jgi:hypothetical protein